MFFRPSPPSELSVIPAVLGGDPSASFSMKKMDSRPRFREGKLCAGMTEATSSEPSYH